MSESDPTAEAIVEFRGITKEFDGNCALRDIDLRLYRGEVHGLLGENGAGKSTLIKILTGVYRQTSGEILLSGKRVAIKDPLDARRHGIGAVYQDVELVGSFTVAENLMLGSEPGGPFIDKKKIRSASASLLKDVGIDIDPDRPAAKLSAAEAQLAVLSTLFYRKYKVLVLDEPTARLSAKETEVLFRLIDVFRTEGVTIVYISHRLQEIKRLCDRVTVLRGGMIAGTREKGRISEEEITQLMVGQDASRLKVENPGLSTGQELVVVRDLKTGRLRDVSFALHHGEVLGITGPVGGGMADVGTALAGLTAFEGHVRLDGEEVALRSPAAARKAGISLIPEDRRREALFGGLALGFNVCLPALRRLSYWGFDNRRSIRRYADRIVDRLRISPDNPKLAMKFFSGGNQQKAVIGKWLETNAKLYIFIEPTAGVDVGAIREIYEIILEMARRGAGIIVISSSIKEILRLSETVLVVQQGRAVLFKRTVETKYDELLSLAMG